MSKLSCSEKRKFGERISTGSTSTSPMLRASMLEQVNQRRNHFVYQFSKTKPTPDVSSIKTSENSLSSQRNSNTVKKHIVYISVRSVKWMLNTLLRMKEKNRSNFLKTRWTSAKYFVAYGKYSMFKPKDCSEPSKQQP